VRWWQQPLGAGAGAAAGAAVSVLTMSDARFHVMLACDGIGCHPHVITGQHNKKVVERPSHQTSG
jgi:hypothetical protein